MAYHRQSPIEIHVSEGEENEFSVQGYKINNIWMVVYFISGILSVGWIFLLGYWYPIKRFLYTHRSCSLVNADYVLIYQLYMSEYFVSEMKDVCWSEEEMLNARNLETIEEKYFSSNFRYFQHMFIRYYYSIEDEEIYVLSGFHNLTVKEIYQFSNGVSEVTSDTRIKIYGENYINVPVKSYPAIFFEMAASPFYVFQVFSFILWYFFENYQIYPSVILLMTLISLAVGMYDTKQHLQNLHDMVGKERSVKVVRNRADISSDIITKTSKKLVPGDIVVIPINGIEVPCDMVLLHGRCIVNESALTGESFPAMKTSVDCSNENATIEIYSVINHKNHTLYNGTQILQALPEATDGRVTALVISTGFSTIKGGLMKSIIFPKPVHFQFFRDSMRFVFCLGILAVLGFIYTAVLFTIFHKPVSVIIVSALDIITIIVSPALPTCMTVGLMYAVKRLKKHQIFTVDSSRVNVCGKIKMFVFDKTGTLTEDSLAISGIIPVVNGVLDTVKTDAADVVDSDMIKGMASCHSLSVINGEVTGDPLDNRMFKFTKWSFLGLSDYDDSHHENVGSIVVSPSKTNSLSFVGRELHIMKQYPFQSTLQRSSVVVKDGNCNFIVYTKGSPEMILSLCTENSKPDDIFHVLEQYARKGHRVLAISMKNVSPGFEWKVIKRMPRSDIECDLIFLGLIIFENALKPISLDIIRTLNYANIRVTMATGDNLYTAVSVAHEVGIIKPHQMIIKIEFIDDAIHYDVLQHGVHEFRCESDVVYSPTSFSFNYSVVLTGETYIILKEKYPEICQKVLVAGSVFARMSPAHKTVLVNDLKELGYGVGMCGDGANDCGALKAAHAGIALSTSEASVASPFTSKKFDISCVPVLIREGRSSLVTSFSAFKYLALYCFIQYFGVLILYSIQTNYADYQFLYADLILCFPLVLTMIQGEASVKLIQKRPPGRLFHPMFLGSIFIHIIIQFFVQLCVFYYVRCMSWYKPPETFHNKVIDNTNYENYSVITISFFQYIGVSFVFYAGKPYNKPLYKNYKYMCVLVSTFILTIVVTSCPTEFLRKLLEFPTIPSGKFIISLIVIAILNFYISFVVEGCFQRCHYCHVISRKILRKKKPRNAYKYIVDLLHVDTSWPPISNDL